MIFVQPKVYYFPSTQSQRGIKITKRSFILLFLILALLCHSSSASSSGASSCEAAQNFPYISEYIQSSFSSQGEEQWWKVTIADEGRFLVSGDKDSDTANFEVDVRKECDSDNLCESRTSNFGNYFQCEFTASAGEYYVGLKAISGAGNFRLGVSFSSSFNFYLTGIERKSSLELYPGELAEFDVTSLRGLESNGTAYLTFHILDESGQAVCNYEVQQDFQPYEPKLHTFDYEIPQDLAFGKYSAKAAIWESCTGSCSATECCNESQLSCSGKYDEVELPEALEVFRENSNPETSNHETAAYFPSPLTQALLLIVIILLIAFLLFSFRKHGLKHNFRGDQK